MTNEAFCVSECARLARSMGYESSLRFLRGFVTLCGDCDEIAALRETLLRMEDTDAQLQLIATGQLKLNLDGNGSAPGGGPQ